MGTSSLSWPTMLAGLGAALLLPLQAGAQSFVGVGPVRSFVLPDSPAASAPAEPAGDRPAAPQRGSENTPALRPLPVTSTGLRFAGEWSEKLWPISLTIAQAAAPATLRLSFLSAISVMPEGSRVTVFLNDVSLGSAPLARADLVASRDFAVPAGLLKAGANALRLRVEQRHRVDCSPAATYELWTVLDPARSGLMLGSAAPGYGPPADIAAIPPRASGAFAIRLAAGDRLSAPMVQRAIKAVQIAALASGSLQPVVTVGAGGADEPSLVLALGTGAPTPAGIARYGFAAGPGIPVFSIPGRNDAELDAALEGWDRDRRAAAVVGAEAGKQALALQAGYAVGGFAERVGLRETGFGGASFAGRRFEHGVDVVMPADFLPADYDRISLDLAGSHAGGLTRDAHILVTVNGRQAATQRLNGDKAGDLGGSRIFLPLSLMRPGHNRIAIVAEVPRPEDASCTAPAAPRLTLLDTTEISMPRVARIGRAPELAALSAGAFPFTQSGVTPILYVPQPDRETMGAALTFVARLAVAAGRPLDFAFTVEPPKPDAGPVLAVSPAPHLAPAMLGELGLDPSAVEAAWRPLEGRKPAGPPADLDGERLARTCRLPEGPVPAKTAAAGSAAAGLNASLPFAGLWASPIEPGTVPAEQAIASGALAFVGQGYRSAEAAQTWTVLSAPDSPTLAAAAECLVHPAQWNRLAGRLAALKGEEVVVVAAGADQRFVETQSFSLPNKRLVLAGWLSLKPLAYVGAALMLVLALAFATLGLVLNTGRRQG